MASSNPSRSKGKGLAGNTSSPSSNFGDHVPDDWTPEQINRAYEAAHKFAEDIPSDEDTTDQPTKQPTTKAPAMLKSEIFSKHFRKVPDPASGPNCFYAICNYCEGGTKKYKFKKGGGYGNMSGHMASKHCDKLGIEKAQTQIAKGFTANSSTPGVIQGNINTTNALFQYNHLIHRKEMAKFVSGMSLPFNFPDNKLYENLTQISLNPATKKISRSTVTRDIRKLVLEEKLKLSTIFLNLNSKVSICSDIWGDHWQMNSYMGITCIWIDDSWTMQKRLIAYREFNQSHSAQNICHKIHSILSEFNLVDKIFSVSFDNASSNTASIEDLIEICGPSIGGKFFHVRCICHVINLCVQDGLELLKSAYAPIRDAIMYLIRHPSLSKKWRQYCRENDMHPKRFSKDVPTRWNSTYDLLNDSYKYRHALCNFFTQEQVNCCLFPNQWDSCSSLMALLKIFKEATESLSGVYYPTSPLVIEHCVKIVLVFKSLIKIPNLKACITEMKNKWLKYFFFIPDVFLVAKLLDPQVREEGLDRLLTLYYNALFPNNEPHAPHPKTCVNKAKQYLSELYKEYACAYNGTLNLGTSSPVRSQPPPPSSQSDFGFAIPDMGEWQVYQEELTRKRTRHNTNAYQELDNYLTTYDLGALELKPDGSNDILKWWAKRSTIFPVVSTIAKELLAVPASTVSVEQAFSVGGYILDKRRSNLLPENLEAQSLMNDWVKADLRQQEPNFNDHEDSDYYESTSSNESVDLD